MKKPLSISLACSVVVAVGVTPTTDAAEFSYEATGSYSNVDAPVIEQDLYGGSLRYFIAPVDESKGPLAEAAFLSRASSLRYSYSRVETSLGFPVVRPAPDVTPGPAFGFREPTPPSLELIDGVIDSNPVVIESSVPAINTHALDTRYVVADTSWIVSSRLSITDGDTSAGNFSTDQDDWSAALTAGNYVLKNTTVSLRVGYDERVSTTESTFSFSLPTIGIDQLTEFASEVEIESVDVTLIGEHVGRVSNYSYRLAANVGFITMQTDLKSTSVTTNMGTSELIPVSDDTNVRTELPTANGWSAGLSGTWYFTNRLGLNANVQFNEVENQKIGAYGAGVSWFVTRNIELRGSYSRSDVDGGFVDSGFNDPEQWGLTLRGRL